LSRYDPWVSEKDLLEGGKTWRLSVLNFTERSCSLLYRREVPKKLEDTEQLWN